MTFYLKYRSQTLNELDLDKVREQLQKIVSSGKMPHAFLFSGPRGAGKTSAARILAKVVNCEKTTNNTQHATKEKKKLTTNNPRLVPNMEPCNECSQCIAITRGSSLDVIEIDAASHRGVEDIRILRETVKLAPAASRMKVYIIDEAHMLTAEAANALLKTLEEPPAHAMFVLATTAPEKLLDTIRSRCTTLNFYKGSTAEIIRSLKRVVEGEKIEIEEEAIVGVAENVDGSFREAHKILEQLSFGGEKITVREVRNLVSSVSVRPEKLLEYLGQKDAKGALGQISQIAEKGVNLKVYILEVVGLLRKMLLAKIGVEAKQMEIDGISNIEDIKQLIELFSESSRQLPTAVIPQLPLEIVVVRWCGRGKDTDTDTDKDTDKDKVPLDTPRKPFVSKEDLKGTSKIPLTTLKDDVEEIKPSKKGTVLSIEDLESKWKEITKQIKAKNHSLEALLKAAKPASFDGTVLQVEVFYPFHKERLEKDQYKKIFEDIASIVLDCDVRLFCILSAKLPADIANIVSIKDEDIVDLAEKIFGENDNVN